MTLSREHILAYLRHEQALQKQEQERICRLSDSDRIEEGLLVLGLTCESQDGSTAVFRCDDNRTRLRSGDRVTLSSAAGRRIAVILENQPTLLVLDMLRADPLPAGDYRLDVEAANLLGPIIQAHENLGPGAPGYRFYKTILEGRPSLPVAGKNSSQVIQDVERLGSDLDSPQMSAASEAVLCPPLLAVQGPPGTGKSKVLAVVAEALVRSGARVCIAAPTHQAINNVLSLIRSLSPDRRLVKIGDEFKASGLHPDIDLLTYPIFRNLLKACKIPQNCILGMSFYSAILHLGLIPAGFAPNVLLIDEAGQLPLTYGALAGILGAGSVIAFGDDQQLPPVFHPDLAQDPVSVSLFGQVRRSQCSSLRTLSVTYRLNSDLCRFIGRRYYPDGCGGTFLVPSPHAADRLFRLPLEANLPVTDPLGPEPFVLVDNSSAKDCADLNESEADLVSALIARALKDGLRADQVAVVTPFRRQSLAVRRALRKIYNGPQPLIDTVERLQGASVEMVVLSTAATKPEYLWAVMPFLLNPNRLNVALSRARTKVVVFGCPSFLAGLSQHKPTFRSSPA